MGWAIFITAAACVVLTLATGGNLGAPFAGWRPLGLAAAAGIFGAGIPSTLFLVGIRTIGGTRAGILMLFEPLVGVTLAALLLHETPLPVQLAGGVAIVAAAVLLQRTAPPGERIEPVGVPSVERS
jgi:drug/metabolite transporter (DMT)-like permease